MRKCLTIVWLLCIHAIARGQTFSYEYWFDNDRATVQTGNSTTADCQITADLGGLTDGFHTIHIQAKGKKGTLSSVATRCFMKLQHAAPLKDGRYWFDNDYATMHGSLPLNSAATIDVSQLADGFHMLHVQAEAADLSSVRTVCFMKLQPVTQAELDGMRLCYYLDNDHQHVMEGQRQGGAFLFDVDVSQLADGLHRISYYLSDGKRATTRILSQLFTKTPVGGYGIESYRYWINDAQDEAVVVALEPHQTEFSLTGQLPFVSRPIRSSCFDYRVEDGQAVIYAIDDFNVRFTDTEGRWAEATRQFVDENRREVVSDPEPLYSRITETMDVPQENEIRWFTLYAFAEDSLQFRTDEPCTLQVFSPTGEEMYRAQGTATEDWAGFRAKAEGRYNVALHDVTSPGCKQVSLDYESIAEAATGILQAATDRDAPDCRYYDLQGRAVTKKPQRGVYIRNRNKYVAR